MAMASSSLLLLLLLFPLSTLVSAGAIPKKGGFYGRAFGKVATNFIQAYLEQQALQKITDIFSQQHSGDGGKDQLGSAAADKAPALVFSLSIGKTAPQRLSVIMDITSELVWALCSCNKATDCLGTPETPFFRPPTGTSSFSGVDCATPACQNSINQTCAAAADHCTYVHRYMSSDPDRERTNTSGYLATETFTFGTTPVDSLVFGCSDKSTVDLAGASGSVGFNRGPLSIVSQLQLSSFSYLISSEQNKSFVAWSWAGDAPAVQPSKHSRSARSTPLLRPKATPIPNLYYVKLTGIEVGGQALPIPAETFDVQVDSSGRPKSGGVILSTTHPVTYLENEAYASLRAELVRKIAAQGVNPVKSDLGHLCYMTKDFASKKVPTVTLVFDGTDAKMVLDVKNYFFSFPADSSGAGGQALECLTILPSSGFSLLGSLLQTDVNMTYDMDNRLLTFDKAAAAALHASLIVTAAYLLLVVCLLFF